MAQRGRRRRVVRQRLDQRPRPLGEPAHDGVRERDRALEAGAADELDRLVDRRVAGDGEEDELVGAEAQRGAHGRVELAHGRRPSVSIAWSSVRDALDGAVGELLRERPLARVETPAAARERAVGVGVVLEHAADDAKAARRAGETLTRVAAQELGARHAPAAVRLHLEVDAVTKLGPPRRVRATR